MQFGSLTHLCVILCLSAVRIQSRKAQLHRMQRLRNLAELLEIEICVMYSTTVTLLKIPFLYSLHYMC